MSVIVAENMINKLAVKTGKYLVLVSELLNDRKQVHVSEWRGRVIQVSAGNVTGSREIGKTKHELKPNQEQNCDTNSILKKCIQFVFTEVVLNMSFLVQCSQPLLAVTPGTNTKAATNRNTKHIFCCRSVVYEDKF